MRAFRLPCAFVAALCLTAACNSGDSSSESTSAAPALAETTAPPQPPTAAPATDAPTTSAAPQTTVTEPPTTEPTSPLRILVTNDDGVGAPGIDTLVNALKSLPDVEVTVIAPAADQSGTAQKTTDGELIPVPATTASGVEALSVAGFPADTVILAVDQGGMAQVPHLVVSGINKGQNMGPAVAASGTVGAAITAAKRGIPAVAVSQGISEGVEPNFPAGAAAVVAWVVEHRYALVAGAEEVQVTNINVPSCTAGEPAAPIEVPVATDLAGRDYLAPVDCTISTAGIPVDDVAAFQSGAVTISLVAPF